MWAIRLYRPNISCAEKEQSMQGKKFQKNDSGFICAVCGTEVSPLVYSSRDHCPKCLSSLHVDIFPGDRANECKGVLRPVRTEPSKDGFTIFYKCKKCGGASKCRSAKDDDTDLLIALTVAE